MNFDDAFTKLLGHEGAYSNHKDDPGGETMWGITKSVAIANGYVGDMKSMPQEVAKAIYKKNYWDKISADKLPEDIRYVVFDGAVNSGVTQAIRWLQMAVGAKVDGVIGQETIAKCFVDNTELKSSYLGCRLKFMTDLPTWASFGKGWARRIASLLLDK